MRNVLRFHLIAAYVTVALAGFSQQPHYAYASNKIQNHRGDFSTQNKQTLLSVLKELNKIKGVYFLYSEENIGNKMVPPVKNTNENVEKILDNLLEGTGLTYKKVSANTYVIIQSGEKFNPKKDLKTSITVTQDEPEQGVNFLPPVKGRITAADGTPLSSVSVMVKGTARGTTTNSNGEFSIEVNRGETLVVCALNDEYSSFIRMPESESLLVGEVAPKT